MWVCEYVYLLFRIKDDVCAYLNDRVETRHLYVAISRVLTGFMEILDVRVTVRTFTRQSTNANKAKFI